MDSHYKNSPVQVVITILAPIGYYLGYIMQGRTLVPSKRYVSDSQVSFGLDTKLASGDQDAAASRNYFKKNFPIVKSNKYLIYTCIDYHLCGGWGDRLRGIYTAYVVSVIQNRMFYINITKPCLIQTFMRPATFDWTLPLEAIKNKTTARHSRLDVRAPPLTAKKILSTIPSADVLKLTMNMNYIDAFRLFNRTREKLSFLRQMYISDIYRVIYHGLFQYKDSFNTDINTFLKKYVNGHHLVGVHIRLGDQGSHVKRLTEEDLETIWKFLESYKDNNKYKIFIASDTQALKDKAKLLFGDQYVSSSGNLLHTDHVRGRYDTTDFCDGLKQSLVDHAILIRSDTLLLTRSGFGIEAAHIRHTSNNLYCHVKNEGIMPCYRENLKYIYRR